MSASLPSNIRVSRHPCLRAKLSQLRSTKTTARETNFLVREISTILGCEALANSLEATADGTETTPLGYNYAAEIIHPSKIALIPILRSGLGMLQAIQDLLPQPVPIHHLGLFREPITLHPVEYYNNLPFHRTTSGADTSESAADLAILLDPVVATGGTAAAAIQTLREWGVKKVILLSVLGSHDGLVRAANEWRDGVEVWVGGVDQEVDGKGMIVPGLGDIGDRLFLAQGK
ncbi:uracil phosphoribosyltransferase, putative [Coccidioides posadasii C735 delta SOWgp]|uniref:uracil phosphoribosyltransferase n=1 Tax=Coccidioides posadasii (strain C735) TaxID=222929 RepID=C5PDV6_COCP7|nr:uracil phosphoribosyltransferase, putative [Coccidioides posadasii C735 delta SOWgp]EER25267.1 uracil phosphoribosyltransferase, putative [Coccidioides posadasii C735 delta SOWgp]|eukprot:XP_003067412.1 uracil phosphoribosyltransferase, putative [Coccidioides posadasii C735 delta SOWgp]